MQLTVAIAKNGFRAGIGVTLMPEYTLPKNATDVSYCYLSDPAITRTCYAIYAAQRVQNDELQVLIASLSCSL